MFDVVVVGGGAIGLYTAKLCEDMGYRVVILEEDREIGKPLKCSGLETPQRFWVTFSTVT